MLLQNSMRCATAAGHFARPRARRNSRPTTLRDRVCACTVRSQWKSMDPTAPRRGRGRPPRGPEGGHHPPRGPPPACGAPHALMGFSIRPAQLLGSPVPPAVHLQQLQPAHLPPRPPPMHGFQYLSPSPQPPQPPNPPRPPEPLPQDDDDCIPFSMLSDVLDEEAALFELGVRIPAEEHQVAGALACAAPIATMGGFAIGATVTPPPPRRATLPVAACGAGSPLPAEPGVAASPTGGLVRAVAMEQAASADRLVYAPQLRVRPAPPANFGVGTLPPRTAAAVQVRCTACPRASTPSLKLRGRPARV